MRNSESSSTTWWVPGQLGNMKSCHKNKENKELRVAGAVAADTSVPLLFGKEGKAAAGADEVAERRKTVAAERRGWICQPGSPLWAIKDVNSLSRHMSFLSLHFLYPHTPTDQKPEQTHYRVFSVFILAEHTGGQRAFSHKRLLLRGNPGPQPPFAFRVRIHWGGWVPRHYPCAPSKSKKIRWLLSSHQGCLEI